jgi:HK97 family phage major capsid protein
MKAYLKKLILSKQGKIAELRAKIRVSENGDEVRSLGKEIEELTADIEEATEKLNELAKKSDEDDDEGDGEGEGGEGGEGDEGTNRSFNPLAGLIRSITPQVSLGQHFVDNVGTQLTERSGGRFSISAPEFRANTDPQVTGGSSGGLSGLLTQVDPVVVEAYRRPTVTDLFGSGTISGQAITYYVEGVKEGAITPVAEGGMKPQIHYANPTAVTDPLTKIAGFLKESDEMIEDLPFLVSEINGRLLYDLSLVEEAQIISGSGSGGNMIGLINRSGIGSLTYATTLSPDDIFKAITQIRNASGLNPDGILINPIDYQTFRLSKDDNGQYYGGGFFAGQYGNDGLAWDIPIWGLRTVITPAVASGSPIVGAFTQGGTVYRKGGVRVEATNSNDVDFTKNLVTIRAEERIALAVRQPSGFVVVTKAA